jgi:hypothetical protein
MNTIRLYEEGTNNLTILSNVTILYIYEPKPNWLHIEYKKEDATIRPEDIISIDWPKYNVVIEGDKN